MKETIVSLLKFIFIDTEGGGDLLIILGFLAIALLYAFISDRLPSKREIQKYLKGNYRYSICNIYDLKNDRIDFTIITEFNKKGQKINQWLE